MKTNIKTLVSDDKVVNEDEIFIDDVEPNPMDIANETLHFDDSDEDEEDVTDYFYSY